jgi:hypothetical protein
LRPGTLYRKIENQHEEKMFDGNSQVAEISTMTEQIEIRSFTIQEKIFNISIFRK